MERFRIATISKLKLKARFNSSWSIKIFVYVTWKNTCTYIYFKNMHLYFRLQFSIYRMSIVREWNNTYDVLIFENRFENRENCQLFMIEKIRKYWTRVNDKNCLENIINFVKKFENRRKSSDFLIV